MMYDVQLHVDIGLLSSRVGEMLDNINRTMRSFGFNETVALRSHFVIATLTTKSPMTDHQLGDVERTLEAAYLGLLPPWAKQVRVVPHIKTEDTP